MVATGFIMGLYPGFTRVIGRRKEQSIMKYTIVLAALVVSFLAAGCMSGYYAHRERRQMVERDSLMPPPMTIDDIIAMAQDSVGDEVILNQMKATHTWFRLTNNDIRDLKKAGVSERVINAMIKSTDEARTSTTRATNYSTSYWYPDYYWYPYQPYFYSPWYSPFYLGFSYRIGGYYPGYYGGGRFYGGGYYGGGRYGGGHSSRGRL